MSNSQEEKLILCERCTGRIISKEELVTTVVPVSITAYHTRCFAEELKGINSFFVGGPINGTQGNVGAVILSIILLIALFINVPWYLIIVLCIPLVIRLWSWFFYERVLEN